MPEIISARQEGQHGDLTGILRWVRGPFLGLGGVYPGNLLRLGDSSPWPCNDLGDPFVILSLPIYVDHGPPAHTRGSHDLDTGMALGQPGLILADEPPQLLVPRISPARGRGSPPRHRAARVVLQRVRRCAVKRLDRLGACQDLTVHQILIQLVQVQLFGVLSIAGLEQVGGHGDE
jgi:hypothetical protein